MNADQLMDLCDDAVVALEAPMDATTWRAFRRAFSPALCRALVAEHQATTEAMRHPGENDYRDAFRRAVADVELLLDPVPATKAEGPEVAA